ncbi:MAG: type II toxin-antitoxin system HicA family toxin [Candidatus Micrarchaeota archaeon]|nr:type II toxin-antitoxin system HicA family toxin [Candidatus Micrarchaeota archaeon]MDE1864408.1 type II toxin-antitoxin system HicA family toxin [Candidatus Micrarchaeota archaeon]
MPGLVIKDVELLRILTKKFGFLVLRQKGSHVRLSNGVRRVTIPIHNRELKQGTLNSILVQVGLTREDILKAGR